MFHVTLQESKVTCDRWFTTVNKRSIYHWFLTTQNKTSKIFNIKHIIHEIVTHWKAHPWNTCYLMSLTNTNVFITLATQQTITISILILRPPHGKSAAFWLGVRKCPAAVPHMFSVEVWNNAHLTRLWCLVVSHEQARRTQDCI